ncbi:MAG: O-antigen ligase family protein [Ottowia sp.]|uniref:O-antigen ligase family protein n=1 Tax=Ottowia sp. TaxID=1898956 RepID=UPI0039E31411
MPRVSVVCWVALFWGFAAFFPIGLNYAAFAALAASMAWQGDWRVRLRRLRGEPNRWPAGLFLGWGLLVLAFGPHYPETASNAFHALRIVLTLALALALSRDEAVWALRGFWLGIAVALALTALHLAVGLPPGVLWDSIVRYGGNKSLANAVLLALAASTGLLLPPLLSGRQRVWALVLALGAMGALGAALYSRTAWLVVIVGLLAGLLHQWRAQRRRLLLAVALVAALALGAGLLVPGVRDRVAQGAHEVASAYAGEQVTRNSSWGVRFRMYTETLAMVRERPVAGWGIGGWSEQWKARVEPELASANMPHNDFLWMGAQAGVPGALLLLWLVAAGLPRAWRRHDMSGRLGVVALLSMLLAVAANSALRDASIGLSVWFVVLVFQRLSTEPEDVWREVLPGA